MTLLPRKTRRVPLAAATGLAAVVATTVLVATPPASARTTAGRAVPAPATAVVNGAARYQTIAGFGASEAFGQAETVMNAPPAVQRQALDLLYSRTSGAGLTILRNEISADPGSTIEPGFTSSARGGGSPVAADNESACGDSHPGARACRVELRGPGGPRRRTAVEVGADIR